MADRPAQLVSGRRLVGIALEAVGWIALLPIVGLLVLQLTEFRGGRAAVPALFALTPYVLLPAIPIAVTAMLAGRHALAVMASIVGVGVLILTSPFAWPPGQPSMPDSATSLSVGHVNLLYENDRLDDAIADLRDVGVDVMAFTEYTPEHAAALLDSELAAEYPYRLDRASGLASGTALWSRYPVRETEGAGTANESLSGVVDVDGTEVRVLVVHPRTPVFNLDGWRHDLADIALTARVTDLPTVVIGDFNASWWHPEYRQLVRTADLRDAHQATGDVWTATWPTDRWFPAFVRLDHALVTDDVAVRSTGDFGIAGTDHRGITVVIETAP